MSAYERAEWRHLQKHWESKAQRRQLLPPTARQALDSAGQRSKAVISQTTQKIAEHTPEPVKRASEQVFDAALIPSAKAAVRLLELAEDWAAEAMNPNAVIKHHRSNGHAVERLADLRALDLEDLDNFTRRMSLRWRSLGAVEGGAMGVLSCIPVAGAPVAITADIVVMQMLSVAVASRALYCYGFDARHTEQSQMIDKIVRRAYKAHAPKAKVLNDSAKAFNAGRNRARWSNKLREDHKLMAAVEKLMKHVGDGKVSVQDVSKKLPYVSIVTSAGTNAYVLGDIAKQGVLYGRTRFLAEKHDLVLPPNLRHAAQPGEDDSLG